MLRWSRVIVAGIHRLLFRRIWHINSSPSILIIIYRIINLSWIEHSGILIIIWQFSISSSWVSSATSMIRRNMGSNYTVLWILWSTIWPRIMLDGIMSTKLTMRHVHLVLDIILVRSHLALISHVITTTSSRVRSLSHRTWWWNSVANLAIWVSAVLICISMILSSNSSTRHLSITWLLASTWNLIVCVLVAVLNSIRSLNIFNILLNVWTMSYCL